MDGELLSLQCRCVILGGIYVLQYSLPITSNRLGYNGLEGPLLTDLQDHFLPGSIGDLITEIFSVIRI